MSYFIAFLKQLDWIDIVVCVLFIRIIFISLKNGLAAEVFKISGAVLASYLALHYYTAAGEYFVTRLGLEPSVIECIVFAILSCLGYAFFSLLRLLLKRFLNMEVVPAISRWGGLVIGIFRAFLISSLLLFFFLTTGNEYLRKSVLNSFCGTGIVYVAPNTYDFIWKTIMSKLISHEKFNSVVFEIEKNSAPKKK